MAELYTNDPSTTITVSMGTGDSSLTVASSTGFPGANFRIRIDNELILVTAVAGTTWTITRAQEGTTAATHTSGATVNHFLTAGALDAIRAEMNGYGAYSSRPTVFKAGDEYNPNNLDSNYSYVNDGSAWQPSLSINKNSNIPPVASSWAWQNQGSATLTDLTGGGLQLVSRTDTAFAGIQQAAPSTPYTITMGFTVMGVGPTIGMYFYNSGDGRMVLFHWSGNNSGSNPLAFSTSKWSSITTFSAVYVNANVGVTGIIAPMLFLRAKDDGTNIVFSWGIDLNTFTPFDTRTRHDYMAAGPTHYGMHIGASVSSQPTIVNILHHKQT